MVPFLLDKLSSTSVEAKDDSLVTLLHVVSANGLSVIAPQLANIYEAFEHEVLTT